MHGSQDTPPADLRPLVALARRGDIAAWRLLLQRVLASTSPSLVRELRDAALRDTYAWLKEAIAPSSHRRVVVAIGEAAKLLSAGRRLKSAHLPFHTLSQDELDRLSDEMGDLVTWCGPFPQLRQLYSVLQEAGGVQSTPLEIAHRSERRSGPVSKESR